MPGALILPFDASAILIAQCAVLFLAGCVGYLIGRAGR